MHGLTFAATLAKRVDDRSQGLRVAAGGQQPVGPAATPPRGIGRHCGTQQSRRYWRSRIELRLHHGHAAAVGDRLACEKCANDGDALGEPRVALGFVGPILTGDRLIDRLAASERDPAPAGIHLAHRRDRLREDRGMVTIPRSRNDPDRKARRLECGAQPRPGEAGLALLLAPGMEVVRRLGAAEARFLGADEHSEGARSARTARGWRGIRGASLHAPRTATTRRPLSTHRAEARRRAGSSCRSTRDIPLRCSRCRAERRSD